MSTPRTNLPRRLLSAGTVVVCLYAPFSWLLWIDYPWSYRLFWLRLWPILPGFGPATLLFHPHQGLGLLAMGWVAPLLLIGLMWLGTRGRVGLVLATILALMISIPSAWIAYAVFRA